MPKVVCAATECKYNGEEYICMADEIRLRDSYIHTVYDGLQHFNTCMCYEKSEEANELERRIYEYFKTHN